MAETLHAVTVPKWGLSMEEGTVAEWLVETGGTVAVGDEIVYLETSKIAGALESPFQGILRRRVAQPGDTLPVGALLGVIADAAVDDAVLDAFVAEFQESFVPEEPAENAGRSEPEYVEAGGTTIGYRKVTARGGNDGVPVVLVHGFGGDGNSWLFNMDALAGENDVYAIDLPGHGVSSKQVGDGTVESLGAIAGEVLDALEIGRAHLAGHSLGGATALSLAVNRPRLAASLSLLAPCGLGPDINMEFIIGFISAARRKDMKPVLQSLFANPGQVTREMVEDVLKFKRIDGVTEALTKIAEASFPNGTQAFQYRDRLESLPMPVLAIWGAEDSIVSPGDGEGLPVAVEVHILEGAGHMPQMEAAASVNGLLSNHIHSAK